MLTLPLKIVHLEDSVNDALLIEQTIQEHFDEYCLVRVDKRDDYLKAIQEPGVGIVISDYALPSYDGIQALGDLRRVHPDLPFIFVSGAMGEDLAVECMKIGATDYIFKSNLKRLPAAIRKAREDRDTRRLLQEAARAAKVVPWTWDEKGDHWIFDHLVKDVLGFAQEALEQDPDLLKSRIHPEDLPHFGIEFSRAKEANRLDFDCRFHHADGHWIWTRWTLARHEGRYQGILQDITELRMAQDALIQSQRLENLGLMIGGITHDFGNLISAISMAVEMLSTSQLTEQQTLRVELIANSCRQALEFRNELIRLARKEDAPAKVRLDLNQAVQEAVTLLRHAIPKAVKITFEPGERLPPVQAVPSQILQVLMNLGLNARDAMAEKKGWLRLQTGTTRLGESEAIEKYRPVGTYVFVDVEDTGPGIPPDLLPHIFEAFFTTKEKGKGTGLGLAIVRAIVQQHDGVIHLEPRPGEGTRFRILLPAAREEGTTQDRLNPEAKDMCRA